MNDHLKFSTTKKITINKINKLCFSNGHAYFKLSMTLLVLFVLFERTLKQKVRKVYPGLILFDKTMLNNRGRLCLTYTPGA